MLIFGNKKQTSQKSYYKNTYFLNNVGLHAKSQPLLSRNEKKCKMSVRTVLPRALQLKVLLMFTTLLAIIIGPRVFKYNPIGDIM